MPMKEITDGLRFAGENRANGETAEDIDRAFHALHVLEEAMEQGNRRNSIRIGKCSSCIAEEDLQCGS